MASVAEVCSELEEAVGALCAADPTALGSGDTIVFLHRQLARLEAATTRAAAAFDAGRSWEAHGARSAAAWIAVRCHVPRPAAQRRVRLGRELRTLPLVEEAWLGGDVGEAQVQQLARARTPKRGEVFARDEELLVGFATKLRYGAFARALAYWCYRGDPAGCEDEAEKDYEARRFHLSRGFANTWVADGLFDVVGGTIVASELERIEQELFDVDWAQAKARVGEGVCAADLGRSPAQRRADALAEMAERSRAMPAGSRMPEPLFSVFVNYETFAGPICELASGLPVTPGSLLRYLDTAWIERVVFESPSRVIDMGARRRLFTGATRRAVQVRDRECFHEFCDLPAERCEIDHIEPWSAGGLTTEGNGRAACDFHNQQRHRRP